MSIGRIALIFLLAQLAPPQPQRTGTASVEGVIVRLGTNEPISGVDLELTDTSLTGPPAGSTVASTPVPFAAKSGSDGRFAIRNLPSGTYKLVAARIGGLFVPVEYGQRGVLGRGVSFPLGEGQQMRDIRLEMSPVGTITGRVFDENARPVGHAAVMALSPMYRDDQQVLNIMGIRSHRRSWRISPVLAGTRQILRCRSTRRSQSALRSVECGSARTAWTLRAGNDSGSYQTHPANGRNPRRNLSVCLLRRIDGLRTCGPAECDSRCESWSDRRSDLRRENESAAHSWQSHRWGDGQSRGRRQRETDTTDFQFRP